MRYYFNDVCFDASDGRLSNEARGSRLTLRPQAGRLLECFVEQPRQVLDRETLCRAVWQEGTVVDFESGLAALIRELRQAFDEVGAGADLLETVPRRGYRFLAHPETGDGKRESSARESGRRKVPALVAAVIAVIVAGGALAWFLLSPSPVAEGGALRLAILPFEVYDQDGDERRIELLMADSVLAALWEADLENLDLIGRATLRPYHQRDDVAAAVARDLGVDLIIEGNIRGGDDEWMINARLLRMPAGRVLWSESIEWAERPQLPVGESAESLVANLQSEWPSIVERLGFMQVSD